MVQIVRMLVQAVLLGGINGLEASDVTCRS